MNVPLCTFFSIDNTSQIAEKLPQGWEKTKKRRHVYTNRGFTDNEDFIAFEEGVTLSRQRGQAGGQVLSTGNKDDKILHSFPKPREPGKLHRGGSHRSLDETVNCVDTETVSVILESQDIIGLGFNICGSYGDGIRVSEVHNRGPAKESGLIKVGDRILSVTVYYQNIVYEDALTILSYASPYPVKIVLEKVTDENLKNFVDIKEKGTQRIKHPLYHSRSLDTVKSVTCTAASAYPKRAVTDLKLESVKHLLNWHSKNSKNGHKISNKDGTTLTKHLEPRNGNPAHEEGKFIIWEREFLSDATREEVESAQELRLKDSVAINSFENKNPGYLKADSATFDTAAAISSASDMNYDNEYACQNTPLNKTEKKNKKSEIQNSSKVLTLESDQTTPSTKAFAYTITSVTDDEIDVDEMVTEPEISAIDTFDNDQKRETFENMINLVSTLELMSGNYFDNYTQPRLPSSVKADSLEKTAVKSFNRSETLFPIPSDEFASSRQDLSRNNSKIVELQNPPTQDEEMINRTLAMNAFSPDNESLEGIPAKEPQGGTTDDFVLNDSLLIVELLQKSKGEVVSKLHKPTETELSITSEKPAYNNYTLYQDDFMIGSPFSVKVNKQKDLVEAESMQLQPTLQYPDASNGDESLSASLRFVDNQAISQNSDSSTDSPESTNYESVPGDTLEWSGTRLVRSKSFSNIFVTE